MKNIFETVNDNLKWYHHSVTIDKSIVNKDIIDLSTRNLALQIGIKLLEDNKFKKTIKDADPYLTNISLEILCINPEKLKNLMDDLHKSLQYYNKEHQRDNILDILAEMKNELDTYKMNDELNNY